MRSTRTFNSELVALRPVMLKIAIKLTRDRDRAEDLIQDAMVKALECQHQYQPGTNLGGWLHVIMRNICYSQTRRARIVQFLDAAQAGNVLAADDPPQCIEMLDMRAALAALPLSIRQAVMLAAAGLSQDEIAVMTGVEVGTVKSRISRGRNMLRAALGADSLRGRFEVTAEAARAEMLGEMGIAAPLEVAA